MLSVSVFPADLWLSDGTTYGTDDYGNHQDPYCQCLYYLLLISLELDHPCVFQYLLI